MLRHKRHFTLILFVYVVFTPLVAATPLRLAWESLPRSSDPRFATDANSQYLSELLHCQLVSFDPKGQTSLDLAEKSTWTQETVLELDIKKDILFSDKTPVTAKDIAATYRYFQKEGLKHPSPRSVAFHNLKTVEALSPNKVRFTLNSPDASFLQNLVIGILPQKHILDQVYNLDNTSVNCGPFQPTDHGSHHITLKPNPNYKLGSIPKHPITIKIVQDETTRYAKLRAGELDIVQNLISREKIKEFEKNEDFKVLTRPGLRTSYIGFNMRDPVLRHPQIREAIDLAINRSAIIQHLLQGHATTATSLLLPQDPYQWSDAKSLHHPEEAKRLVRSLTKKPLKLKLTTTTDRTRNLVAKAIQQDLRKIGIQLDIEALEWGRFKQEIEKGHVQMWMLEWIGFKDPDILRYAFSGDHTPPNGGNRGWFENKEFDQLSQLAQKTTNFQKRKESYKKMQIILQKERPYVYLWHEDMIAIHRTHIKGFQLYADGRLRSLNTTHIQ